MRFRFNGPILLALLCAAPLGADNWPQFRGPDGQGISAETGLALQWSATDKVRWKTPLPGPGHSSPIVWGDRVFLTAFRSTAGMLTRMTGAVTGLIAAGYRPSGQLFVLSLDRASGRLLWQRDVSASRIEQIHSTNSPASPTPVTDGTLVYSYFGSRGVVAHDFNGALVWEKPLGPYPNEWGSASSPVLYGDALVLNVDTDGDDFLLALDKRTGKTLWQTLRPNAERAWPTPVLWRTPAATRSSSAGAGASSATTRKPGRSAGASVA